LRLYLSRMTQAEALQIFRETGALLDGHFVLRSGLHSRQFFQCAQALQQMPVVEKLGAALADRVRGEAITTVVAPAMGGLVIGQEVARQLGVRFIFVEKDDDGELVMRRGFTLAPDEKVLIVEDVITRGGRLQETIDIVRAQGADLRAVTLVVDRSNGNYQPDVPLHSLLAMEVETFEPDNLPEDLQNTEAVKPGSK
jgi:orotate phosphoribosyltransferase